MQKMIVMKEPDRIGFETVKKMFTEYLEKKWAP